ncbi:hypothetical protein QJQ45_017458 [Haematococcus lacustris]|nr:hypothetical protein QJQ45_017458 [Haematococcus lacustris]
MGQKSSCLSKSGHMPVLSDVFKTMSQHIAEGGEPAATDLHLEAPRHQAAPQQGFHHHLFAVGPGFHLPVGQEPFSSFVFTRIRNPRPPSTSQTPGGSSPPAGSSADQLLKRSTSNTHSDPARVVRDTLSSQQKRHPLYTATAIVSAFDVSVQELHACCGTLFGNDGVASPRPSVDDSHPEAVAAATAAAEQLFPGNEACVPSLPAVSHGCGNGCIVKVEGTSSNLVTSSLFAVRQAFSTSLGVVAQLRAVEPTMFIIACHPLATEDAVLRHAFFVAGRREHGDVQPHICGGGPDAHPRAVGAGQPRRDVRLVWPTAPHSQGLLDAPAPVSAAAGGSRQAVQVIPAHRYHINEPNKRGVCQVCKAHVANLAVHVHEQHCPGAPQPEIRTGVGALVVVHRPADNKFLMVQEFAGLGYWTPGGGSNPGERLTEAARREVLEETGVEVEIKGLLQVDFDLSHRPLPYRLATFYAVPKASEKQAPPKTVPDFESAGACWVSVDQLQHIPLRSAHPPLTWFPAVAEGRFQLLPLEAPEHAQLAFKGLTF